MDLLSMYINRGQFGEFVSSLLESEYERKKEIAEKDDEWKLWFMFINSDSQESFNDWKKRVLKSSNGAGKTSRDEDLDDDGIKAIIDDLFQENTITGG